MAAYVKLTERMIEKATAYESKIIRTRTVRRHSNFTGLETAHRYFFGFLGELAFVSKLDELGIKYDHFVRTDGMAADSKLILYTKEGPWKVIVRTASKETHQMLFVPQEKFMREECHAYIGIRLNLPDACAEIWGWIMKGDFFDLGTMRSPSGVMAYSIPLYQLKPIESLINKLCLD